MSIFSKEVELTIKNAFTLAKERKHEFVTVEHLLLALLDNSSALDVLNGCNMDISRLKLEVGQFINETTPILSDEYQETQATKGFQRVLQRAVFHVQSSGRKEVTGANVLVAIFGETETQAVYLLTTQGMTRLDAANYTAKVEVGVYEEGEIEDAFEVEYDENFDYKDLLRLREEELEALREEFERIKNEKKEELRKQSNANIELKDRIKSLESVIGGLKRNEGVNKILRSIEFKPEHRQAGLSILSYFSEVVSQKYPEKVISVSIEQEGNVIRLCVQTEDGDKETIEKLLDTYGMVVIGRLSPNKLLSDPFQIAQLEHKLDLANAEIRSVERLLKIKDDTIWHLKESMEELICINQRSQKSLDSAINKISGSSELNAAIKLIDSLKHEEKLTKVEAGEIQKSVKLICKENPGAIDELRNYFLNVSSSMVGSIVLDTLKSLGFV